jgi:hypothetical protein
MGTKLYVGNLSYNTTSEELSSMFARLRQRPQRAGDRGPHDRP